ncbi:hypothetical protein [Streptomyces sp. NRRL F-5630]|uniref:hypothetical protein n=1 Tax=Streptomyces sp. NRRL F-5630 TaxID=1463864 RepID=UPI003D717FBE
MSAGTYTWVGRAHGPVHTGEGHQYITQYEEPDPWSFRRVADDHLDSLVDTFVPPPGFASARTLLRGIRTVFLDGEPGSGRSTAAAVLLAPLGAYRELLPGENDEPALREPEVVSQGDLLLLDLSAVDHDRWESLHQDLPTLRAFVRERDAHLVVVLPPGVELAAALQRFRVEIGRPRGLRVLRRHLEVHKVPPPFSPVPAIDDFLGRDETRSMTQIAFFADLVRRSYEADRTGDLAAWAERALRSFKGRRTEVAAQVAGMREAGQRALLLAVALLHGKHADVVHEQAAELLRTLGGPVDDRPLLQREDLLQRLDTVGARIGADGGVRFLVPGQETEARTHFWDTMPEIRGPLGRWAAGVPEPLRPRAAENVAAEYLRTGHADTLHRLALSWCGEGAAEGAAHLLARGLGHSVHGGATRRWLYERSRAHPSPTESFVLAQVCGNFLAVTHPHQALVRLHHLSRGKAGGRHGIAALRNLVAADPRVLPPLLRRLRRDEHPADPLVFLGACPAEAVTRTVAADVRACWSAVLGHQPPHTWQPYAERWLHRAADSPLRDLLLGILVDAGASLAHGRGAVFAALYACARDAERAAPDPARAATASEALLAHITGAQREARTERSVPV